MSNDDKIYVDAAQPATLNNGAGRLAEYPTLQEAAMAWHRLPPEQTKRATIKAIGGPVYTATEIGRFHYNTKRPFDDCNFPPPCRRWLTFLLRPRPALGRQSVHAR